MVKCILASRIRVGVFNLGDSFISRPECSGRGWGIGKSARSLIKSFLSNLLSLVEFVSVIPFGMHWAQHIREPIDPQSVSALSGSAQSLGPAIETGLVLSRSHTDRIVNHPSTYFRIHSCAYPHKRASMKFKFWELTPVNESLLTQMKSAWNEFERIARAHARTYICRLRIIGVCGRNSSVIARIGKPSQTSLWAFFTPFAKNLWCLMLIAELEPQDFPSVVLHHSEWRQIEYG